eukprot:s3546_g5.t3
MFKLDSSGPDRSVSRQRKHPPSEELCASDWSDWKDLARGSPQGPRRSRSDSSGCRGPQVSDDTNLQPGVAALRDMLGMVRSGYRPTDAAQQPTETGWSILSSTAPYSSLSMLSTPWKTRRYEDLQQVSGFVAAQPQDQLDTPSTVATDSPIDMIWSPRQRWVYEGPAQLVTELPGACRSPRPDSAMTPPRRTRAWLSNPPFSHRVEPQILLPPHTSPPRYAGLRPPGNLLGSISTLPTVTTARIKDWSSKQASHAEQEDGSRSADQALAQQKSPRRKPELTLEATNITVDPEPADVRREDEAFSSGRSPIRQQIDKIQAESAEALRLLGAQRPDQFFGEMPVELEEVQKDDGEVQAASTAADPAASTAADPVTTAGDAEDEVPLDGGEPQTAESEEVGSDSVGLVAAEAASPAWNAEPCADQGEDEAQMDDDEVKSDDFGSRRAGFVAPEAASTAADPATTAGDAEDEAASPAWNAEPCADQGEDEVPAYECTGCIEAPSTAANPEPATGEDQVPMEEVGSGTGFIAPEASAAADPEPAACTGEDKVRGQVDEDNDFDEMEVESQLSSDSFRASPSPVALERAAATSAMSAVGDQRAVREVISLCGRTWQWQAALQLLAIIAATDTVPNVYCFSSAMTACRQVLQWQPALQILLDMEDFRTAPNLFTYSAGISACEGGQWHIALHLLFQMPFAEVQPDAISWSAGISACEKGGQWEMAIHLLSEMPAAGVLPDRVSVNTCISACQKAGHWQLALHMLSDMLAAKISPNEITFNASISSCERGGRWQMALQIVFMMPSAATTPNVITYSASISACEKCGRWEEALHLMSKMQAGRVVPNVISFNAGISACEKGGQWLMALHLLSQIPVARLTPTVVSYNASITACEKSGMWQAALGLLSDMHVAKLTPNVVSYSTSISACERVGHWQAALKIMTEMPTAKVEPTDVCYNASISTCEKAGNWLLALHLFAGMPLARVQRDVVSFSAVISACERRSQWKTALDLWSAIPGAGAAPNVISTSACISACAKGERWQIALQLLAEMPSRQVIPNVVSLSLGISACEQGGQWQMALHLLRRLPLAKIDEAALKEESSSEASGLASGCEKKATAASARQEDQARSEISESAPRSTRGPTQSQQEECSSTTWRSQNSGPAGPSSRVWQESSGSAARSSSEAQDHPEVFTAALGWPHEEAASFMAGNLQDKVSLHSLPRSASGTEAAEAVAAARSADEASPDNSWRSLPRSQSSRSKQEAVRNEALDGSQDEMVLAFGQQVSQNGGVTRESTVLTPQDGGASPESSGSRSRSRRREHKEADRHYDAGESATRRHDSRSRCSDAPRDDIHTTTTGWPEDEIESAFGPVEEERSSAPAQPSSSAVPSFSRIRSFPADSQRNESKEDSDIQSDGQSSPYSQSEAGEKSPASPAQPVARNGASWPTDDTPVEAKEFGWPASSAAFGQRAVSEAAEWPQDDMALAFGQDTSKATASSGVWPQDAFEWPTSQSQTPSAASGSFPAWANEATVAAAPVQPEAGPKVSEPEDKPAAFLEALDTRTRMQSASPTRPTLRRSATQASSESPSKRSIGEDGAHSSSPSRRAQLRRSHTQGDSISPNRRNSTWGTAQARYGDDSGPNLKEDMAQFMPWGA